MFQLVLNTLGSRQDFGGNSGGGGKKFSGGATVYLTTPMGS
jgi:hypothetical protein